MSGQSEPGEPTAIRKKRRGQTRRKLRALLAAGLVLGIGAANTLASWTHESHVGATITTADFLIGGAVQYSNTSGTSGWTSAGLDAVPFNMNMFSNTALEIGGTAIGRFWVRVDPDSAADVTGARLYLDRIESSSPNADHIAFEVYRNATTSTTGCAAGTTNPSGTLVARGESLNGDVVHVIDDGIVIASRTATNTRVCITFRGQDGLLPNDTLDMTLYFTATGPAN